MLNSASDVSVWGQTSQEPSGAFSMVITVDKTELNIYNLEMDI